MALAFLVATLIPLLWLIVVYRLDRYSTHTFRIVLACLAWGIVATRVALLVNTAALESGLWAAGTISRVVAPAVEELAKALFIVYLVRRPRFTYFVDGAVYGFAVGIGFAVVENYHYLWLNPNTALNLAIGRVLSTNLMHASATAISGIGLGLGHFQRHRRRGAGIALLAIGGAIALHMAFNTLVTRYQGSTLALYAIAAAFGFAGALAIGLAIRFGLRQAQGWIGASLKTSARMTAGETAAVDRLDDSDALLEPLAERFGEGKADAARALLQEQARLGILLRNAAELPEGSAKRRSQEEIARVESDMDERRRDIGVYAMIYLRALLPEAPGPLWPGLAEAPNAQSGTSMWQRLDERGARSGARPARLRSPATRRWLLLALYLGLTAGLWLGPRLLASSAPAVLPRVDPQGLLLAQIAAQWLLSLVMLALLRRREPDLWRSLDRRVGDAERRASLRRRLLGKIGRLGLLGITLGLCALVALGPMLRGGPSAPPDPALRPLQVLLIGAVLATAAALIGRIAALSWLVTLVAIGMAIGVLLGA